MEHKDAQQHRADGADTCPHRVCHPHGDGLRGSRQKYGDMQMFVQRLRNMGYADVQLIPTDNGLFMTRRESTWLALKGSAILVGKK